jgi:hypothetical protein
MGLARFQRAAVGAWAIAAGRARGADWWAVAGELAVVVLGILIAFQLDRWSESWRRSRDRELYLERVIEEASGNIASLARMKRQFDEVTAEVRNMVRRVADPSVPAPDGPPTDRACRLLQLPAVRLQAAAVEEGGGADALELVPDSKLRQLLHAAAAMERFEAGQRDAFRATFQRFGPQVDPHADWRPAANGDFSCSFALDAFARDPQAPVLLNRIYRDRVLYGGFHAERIKSQKAIRDRASCLLSESC